MFISNSRRGIFLCVFIFCLSSSVFSQNFAIKNNLLYDAMLTPNLGLEARVADRWTVGVNVGLNPWPADDAKYPKWRHLLVAPQFRYWFCDVFVRDFIEVNAVYSHYQVGGVGHKLWESGFPIGMLYTDVREDRIWGDMVAGGAAYGWSWIVSPHFSIEVEAGVDVGYTWAKRYESVKCGAYLGDVNKWFWMPKFGLNLIYQVF